MESAMEKQKDFTFNWGKLFKIKVKTVVELIYRPLHDRVPGQFLLPFFLLRGKLHT